MQFKATSQPTHYNINHGIGYNPMIYVLVHLVFINNLKMQLQ